MIDKDNPFLNETNHNVVRFCFSNKGEGKQGRKMSNAVPSRVGQANAGGDVTALFLKVYAGQVLGAFNAANIMKSRVYTKGITAGKSTSFPATGLATAGYHAPGAEILGSAIAHNEVNISVDGIWYSSSFIDEWDELINHWDVRTEYAKQQGEALAKDMDSKILTAGILSARDTANVTGVPGGSDVSLPTGITAVSASGFAQAFAQAMYAAKQTLVENSVSETPFCVVSPAVFYTLAQCTDLYNRDFSSGGDYANASLKCVAGIDVIVSQNLPSTNVSANPTGAVNTYSGDFSKTCALVMCKSSVGLLTRKGLTVEKNYDPRRFGTLLTARQCFGVAPLRPETAVEIKYAVA